MLSPPRGWSPPIVACYSRVYEDEDDEEEDWIRLKTDLYANLTTASDTHLCSTSDPGGEEGRCEKPVELDERHIRWNRFRDRFGRTVLHRLAMDRVEFRILRSCIDRMSRSTLNSVDDDRGESFLHVLCRTGNLEAVRYVVLEKDEVQFDIQDRTSIQATPLAVSCMHGHAEIADILLRAGSPSRTGSTVSCVSLTLAACFCASMISVSDCYQVLQVLSSFDLVHGDPLMPLIEKRFQSSPVPHLRSDSSLLYPRIPTLSFVDWKLTTLMSPLLVLLKSHHFRRYKHYSDEEFDMMKFLIDSFPSDSPSGSFSHVASSTLFSHVVAARGEMREMDLFRKYLSEREDKDVFGRSFLNIACDRGVATSVDFFFRESRISSLPSVYGSCSQSLAALSASPLLEALFSGKQILDVSFLDNFDSSFVNQVLSDGRNPLVVAVEMGLSKAVKMLLSRDDVLLDDLDGGSQRRRDGYSALMIAIDSGNIEIVEHLCCAYRSATHSVSDVVCRHGNNALAILRSACLSADDTLRIRKLLLECGCKNRDSPSVRGSTPLSSSVGATVTTKESSSRTQAIDTSDRVLFESPGIVETEERVCGYLCKLGGLFRTKWQQRWFELIKDEYKLLYYIKEPGKFVHRGHILLRGCRCEEDRKQTVPRQNRFVIHIQVPPKQARKTEYFLSASSADDMYRWLETLSLYSREAVERQVQYKELEPSDPQLNSKKHSSSGTNSSSSTLIVYL